MEKKVELKPCQLCGSEAYLEWGQGNIDGSVDGCAIENATLFWVACGTGFCSIRTDEKETEEEAINCWNKRVNV